MLAVGDPLGVGQAVTQGIVSATGGNRLGINTAIYSQSGGSQGIDFAIPVSLARQVMEQSIATSRVSRGWLGVSARDATPRAQFKALRAGESKTVTVELGQRPPSSSERQRTDAQPAPGP